MMNDFKDFYPDYTWMRASFSDIRNGLVTVPIKVLWDNSDHETKKRLRPILSHRFLDRSDSYFVVERLKVSGALKKVMDIIMEQYEQGLHDAQLLADPLAQQYLCVWINYKQEQLREIK